MDDINSGPEAQWRVCPRCGVHIIGNSVRYSHRPDESRSADDLSKRVCQWAYAADSRDGKISNSSTKPLGCINPCYDRERSYGSLLDDLDSLPPF